MVHGRGGGELPARDQGAQLGHPSRCRVGRHRDDALGTGGHQGEREGIITAQDGETGRAMQQDLVDLGEIAGCLLDRGDAGHFREREGGARLDVATGAARHVVDDHRQPGIGGDRAKVREDAPLRRLVVHRRDVEQMGRARLAHHARVGDGLSRVVGASARHHRHPALHDVNRDLDDAPLLVRRHRDGFSGRTDGHDEVDALGELPRDQCAQRGLVNRATRVERRHEGGATSAQGKAHGRRSLMVKVPVRPTSQSAATNAPSAKTRRSRAS